MLLSARPTEGARAQFAEKENKKSRDRAMLARGERPPREKYQPYGEEDEGLKGGFLIPLAPFGIPKYDNGERFDLKARGRGGRRSGCAALLVVHGAR